MAGVNAVQSLRGAEPLVLSRDQAYIGVLIDDLVTKGTDCEPYRMFTSRAEYRLLLREDNADLRLTEISYKLGLATPDAYRQIDGKKHMIEELATLLEQAQITPNEETNDLLAASGSSPLKNQISLAQLLRRPEITLNRLRLLDPRVPQFAPDVESQVEVQTKYAGYVDRQTEVVRRFQKLEGLRVPVDFDYGQISGLSREAREKLTRIRPRSLGQASRISGITPAAISLLAVFLKREKTA
jgi:tRNA uridine 5-carboxymethylaminomethyl modification enzyme